MFWAPSRGLHPLSSYEAVSRVEDLPAGLPCPACGARIKPHDSLNKARNIRCAACDVVFHWSPKAGVSLPNNHDRKVVQPQSSVPESGTPLRDLKPSSAGGPGQFFGGFFLALIVSLIALVLLWDLAGIKNITRVSVVIAIGAGIATLVLADRKRWRKSGAWAGLLLVLNPFTLTFLNSQGYGDISTTVWDAFSSGPDYEALVAEADTLAGQARREINQGNHQQGMNTLSEATMSASLGNDIELAEQLLEELIQADKEQ